MKYFSDWHKFEEDSLYEEKRHLPMEQEFSFYKAVASGDTEAVRTICERNDFADMRDKGRLSEDPLLNMKFHFVINTAMCSRFCVEMGMSMEESYKLSDYYIQRTDLCSTKEEVLALQKKMCLDYTERMRERTHEGILPGTLSKCLEYIYVNITKRISAADLAKVSGFSESYLTQLFKKETGYSVGNYIRMKKIDYAKKLLKFTDYSIAEISDTLCFTNQSHFICVFRKITGTTPKKYRDLRYCKHTDYPEVADKGELRIED